MKTKIVCTIGPASGRGTMLRKMMLAGMDVARLNFSHGSWSDHAGYIEIIRDLNEKYHRHVRILQDLEGFRIRVGSFMDPAGVVLIKHAIVWLTQEDLIGDASLIPFDYKGLLADIRSGRHIYIDDGNIDLLVVKCEKKRLKAKVVVGGKLKAHKGINIPGVRLCFSGLTGKDIRDIRFGVEQKVDFIAQSFIRDAGDVRTVRRHISKLGAVCGVIAKIENRDGIRHIDEIIDASNGIMIARGDMGVSIPICEVPIVQKTIIRKCNMKKKFVITATQMLESMTENIRPTRAEATDVANAILDGTDYVMLSAETAAGKYPAESVTMMNGIIKFTEGSAIYKKAQQ